MINVVLTFKDDLNAFLKNNAIWLAIGLVSLIIIAISLIFILGKKAKK